MEAKDLLEQVFNRWDFFLTMWAFFLTLVLGVFGFLASNESARTKRSLCLLLIMAFPLFAILHLTALITISQQWAVLADATRVKFLADG